MEQRLSNVPEALLEPNFIPFLEHAVYDAEPKRFFKVQIDIDAAFALSCGACCLCWEPRCRTEPAAYKPGFELRTLFEVGDLALLPYNAPLQLFKCINGYLPCLLHRQLAFYGSVEVQSGHGPILAPLL